MSSSTGMSWSMYDMIRSPILAIFTLTTLFVCSVHSLRSSLSFTPTSTLFRSSSSSSSCKTTTALAGSKRSVYVVGGGFGGLYTAIQISKTLGKDDEIFLIEKKDQFVFLPLLYDFAFGSASSTEVTPKYSTLLTNSTVNFIQAEAQSVDFKNKTISFRVGGGNSESEITTKAFDQVVLSVGIQPRLSLIPGATEHCIPFYRVEDAYNLKQKLNPLLNSRLRAPIRVAVIGGGYSGVEVACTISETIGVKRREVTLFDRNFQILATSSDHNRATSERALSSYGVTKKMKHSVKEARDKELVVIDEDGVEQTLPFDIIILTSGTQQSQFIEGLDIEKDPSGRVLTRSTLQSKSYPFAFALGDCSSIEGQRNPTTAQVAMQQSGTVARNVNTMLSNELKSESASLSNFQFLDLGEMLTLGMTNASVTSLGGYVKLSGPVAALGRRLIYAVRMPTTTQAVKALITAGSVTTGKLLKSFFASIED